MTRDQAILIARRIMDRCEIDRALHLDAIADEVMAGVALIGDPPAVKPMTRDELRVYEREILKAEMDVLGLPWTSCGTGVVEIYRN